MFYSILVVLLFDQLNHVFALLISKPRFIRINFYQDRCEIKLFLQKNTKFSRAGGSTPKPITSFLPIADFWLHH